MRLLVLIAIMQVLFFSRIAEPSEKSPVSYVVGNLRRRISLATYLMDEYDNSSQIIILISKYSSLSRVLHCDKTRQAFENTKEI